MMFIGLGIRLYKKIRQNWERITVNLIYPYREGRREK